MSIEYRGRVGTASRHSCSARLQVAGVGHGGQPFGCQPFSLQPPESGCQLPMAEWPTPELPTPDTRHRDFLPLPILNTPYSILSYRLFHQASEPLGCSPCQRVTMPTCPLAASRRSPLHRSYAPICTFARYACFPCPRVTMPACPLEITLCVISLTLPPRSSISPGPCSIRRPCQRNPIGPG